MSAPRVSIIIPCYNHGAFIEDALNSVYAQTFTDYELIVVNDGSTEPATNRLLGKLVDNGLKVLQTGNRGPAAARNLAISIARGEYILPLDADDRIASNYLALAVEALDRNQDVRVVYGRVVLFGERSGEWDRPDYSPSRILLDNMIVATALFRREDWKRVGGYRENMRNGWEDWDFWLALLADGGRVEHLDEMVFYYRIRGDSRDRTLNHVVKLVLMAKLLVRHRDFYRKYWRSCLLLLVKKMIRFRAN
jgi:glycosyltransferase involved in cell wall biosynthesis